MKILTTLLFIAGSIFSYGQSFKDTGFNHYTISKKDLGSYTIHVTRSNSNIKKPLLIYLDGSGNFPLYYKTRSGRYSTAVPLDVKKYAKDYHVVLISKPGIPFSDSLQYSASGRGFYPENDAFRRSYSLEWRAAAASEAIRYVLKLLPVDKNKIVVMGYSEGAQVAPRVAVLNKQVTHVVCFVGNALSQFCDFILEARLQAYIGEITPDEGQRIVDSLYTEYAKIYQDPASVEKRWYGETYLKWSSFTATSPLENMLKLDIPILYVGGGKDNNQPVFNMDYAKLEFLRKGKTNLTYKVYSNCDHYFQEKIKENGEIKKADRIDEVHQFAIDWINSK